ncbi:Uncharacterised protein [Mycobacteroides abscessus subsp. abscessus]|nr:Uncharacterised protein [Mycobacteroides abscessus subsp. abscessus]
MGDALRIHPAEFHFQTDSERAVSGNLSELIFEGCVSDIGSGREKRLIKMGCVCPICGFEVNKNVLSGKPANLFLHIFFYDRLHKYMPPFSTMLLFLE